MKDVTEQQLLQFYKTLLELTQEMVLARQDGNWDLVDEIVRTRQEKINDYNRSFSITPSKELGQQIKLICKQIQESDKEILEEAIQWQAQIKQFLIR